MTQYARKDLFQTFKFFTTEEEVLDFSTKESPGEMTMAYDAGVEPVSVGN